MDQRMRTSLSRTSTVLNVVYQGVLSLRHTSDYVLQLHIPPCVEPLCMLGWCYAIPALVDVDAKLDLDALWNVKPVQLIMEYPRQPLSYIFICVSMRATAVMTHW